MTAWIEREKKEVGQYFLNMVKKTIIEVMDTSIFWHYSLFVLASLFNGSNGFDTLDCVHLRWGIKQSVSNFWV
jgi:hypothetical protein